MEFICTSNNCKHTFYPHRYIALRHPNKAKCPKCGTKGIMTKKGKETFGDIHFHINQSDFRNKRY